MHHYCVVHYNIWAYFDSNVFPFDFLEELRSRSLQSKFSTTTIVIIVTTIRSGENSHEKQLMIVDGEGQFDQDVLAFGNQFQIEYDQLVEAKKF